MEGIISRVDTNKTIQHLYQLQLLNKDEVRVIYTTDNKYRNALMVWFVADRIFEGNKVDLIARVATLMESHWALKHLYTFWQHTCKRYHWQIISHKIVKINMYFTHCLTFNTHFAKCSYY